MWTLAFGLFVIFNSFVTIIGNRIAGGDSTSISLYPFSAALLTDGGSGQYQQGCGGAILSTTAILSAASCFHSNEGVVDEVARWRARVGSSYSNSGGSIHFVQDISVHPEFSISTRANDIAVLRTTVRMVFISGIVEAARIAGPVYTLTTNQPVWAIGYGAVSSSSASHSDELRSVQIWVVNQETCTNRYNGLDFNISANMVCAGWLDVGVRGQCQGDYGSPLVVDGVVVGVHSWTEGCGDGRYPGVNTLVAPYARWIEATATA